MCAETGGFIKVGLCSGKQLGRVLTEPRGQLKEELPAGAISSPPSGGRIKVRGEIKPLMDALFRWRRSDPSPCPLPEGEGDHCEIQDAGCEFIEEIHLLDQPPDRFSDGIESWLMRTLDSAAW
jgi:hypothetical protein